MLDMLLDQEGLEVDPVDRLEADIPLHKAVRFVNGLGKEEWEGGAGIVELLLDAGADPRFVLFSSLLSSLSLHCCFLPLPPLFVRWDLEQLVLGNWKYLRTGCLCYPILSIWGDISHT